MKSKGEILKRAIVLLAFADRCSLEDRVIEGKKYTLHERENQRVAISDWLKRNSYYECFTPNELRVMEKKVFIVTDRKILGMEVDHECIEPLLWSVNLVNKLSKYDGFVLDDFHYALQFGKDHSFESLESITRLRPYEDLQKHRELAMLWYWRCLEFRRDRYQTIDLYRAIRDCFGQETAELLNSYRSFNRKVNDFTVKGRPVSDLSDSEFAKLEVIAERRFYAFEWMLSDEDWDHVSLSA